MMERTTTPDRGRNAWRILPVVLFAGLAFAAFAELVRSSRTHRVVALATPAFLIVLEITRWLLGPQIVINGRVVSSGDPWSLGQHTERP
jgi:hypothetical protein